MVFGSPWSPPSRHWGGASEGERKGREGLSSVAPFPKMRGGGSLTRRDEISRLFVEREMPADRGRSRNLEYRPLLHGAFPHDEEARLLLRDQLLNPSLRQLEHDAVFVGKEEDLLPDDEGIVSERLLASDAGQRIEEGSEDFLELVQVHRSILAERTAADLA